MDLEERIEFFETASEADKQIVREITEKARQIIQKDLNEMYGVWIVKNIHDRPIVSARLIHSKEKVPALHDKIFSGTRASCEKYCNDKKIEIISY